MRAEFHEIVSGWTLIDGLDDLTARIEQLAEWTRDHQPLEEDEWNTIQLMIATQIARGEDQ